MSIPNQTGDKKLELDIARNSAIALVKEYQSQWFINLARRGKAQQLIRDLEQVDDLGTMIKMLNNYQLNLVKSDIQANRSWRLFAPLHRSGESRLQNTISSALNLASALHHKEPNNCEQLLEILDQADWFNTPVIKQQIKTASKHRGSAVFFACTEKGVGALNLDKAFKL